jgi:hypothetical protein
MTQPSSPAEAAGRTGAAPTAPVGPLRGGGIVAATGALPLP